MKMKVRIEGWDDIAKNLRAMGKSLTRKTLVPVMRKNLKPMADDMRGRAPRGTGELADSVRIGQRLNPSQQAKRERIAPIEMFVGPGPLPQAIQAEFGNYRQAPQPFVRPAFDAGVDAAITGIAKDGVQAILSAAKKG